MLEILSNIWGILIFSIPFFFTGYSSRNVSIKKGRSGKEGFILGFLLLFIGLVIVYLLPTKNNFQPIESFSKRIINGIIRLVIFLLVFIGISFYYIYYIPGSGMSDYDIFLNNLSYGYLIMFGFPIGGVWILRGNSNFLKLKQTHKK